MKKIRVLYIESNRDGSIGGSYFSLLYLIAGLNKDIYEPVVMFYEKNSLLEQFQKYTNEIIILNHESPSSGRINNLNNLLKFIPRFVRDILYGHFELLEKIDEIKPDIVHLNNSYAFNHDWVLACRRRGVKIVAHDRGTLPPASFQTKLFTRFLDAIICVSDTYLKYVTDQELRPKIACRVYNGLNINEYDGLYSPAIRSEIRQEFGVKSEDILVGMIGNIINWKGQIVLVNAMTTVMQKHKNIKAVLVGKTVIGSEDYEADIRSCILQNNLQNNIYLTGYREDIPALLDSFDIFVHASIEPEPFGRVIIEAMAMKKPIVATKLGGPAEIIVDGESGILVEMNDEIAMANAIIDYIDDKCKAENNGNKAYDRVVKNFSAQKMVKGVEAVYQKVLAY